MISLITNKTKNLRIHPAWIVFWLIWPLGAFLGSIRNYRTITAKFVFWLFCVFIGLTFVVPRNTEEAPDSARYAAELEILHSMPFSFQSLWDSFYDSSSRNLDIYKGLVTWIVACFTGDPRWLFALFAAVFGYFYVQNLWMIFDRIEIRNSLILFLFILGMALVNPIWNINGARMYTAAQIFLFGCLLFFLRNEKKGLLWCASSILVHFSFMFPVALLLFYIFLPKRTALLFAFYIVASFVKEINLAQIQNLLYFLPDIFHVKINSYTDVDYALAVAEKENLPKSIHVVLNTFCTQFFIYFWVITLYFTRKSWFNISPDGESLYNFALFFGGWAQIADSIPSMGRFISIDNNIFFVVLVLIISKINLSPKLNMLAKLTSPLLIFTIIFSFRIGFGYIGPLTFIGNPILASFMENSVPLISYIKSIF